MRKIIIFTITLSLTITTVLIPHIFSAPRTIKAIIVDNYQPYSFVNDQGQPDGFSVDLLRSVAHEMGMEVDIRVDTWEQAKKALTEGTIDVLPMMAYSLERDKIYDFSVPHTIAYDAIFVNKADAGIRSLKDLTGKTVIVMNRDAANDYLVSSGLSGTMRLILMDSLQVALRKLEAGEGDAVIMPKLVGLSILKKLNMSGIVTSGEIIEAYNRPFSFAVREGNQALLERLNQGLLSIKSTGQYDEIYKKWFAVLEEPHIHWKTVGKIFVVPLALLVGFVIWNVSLKRQVRMQTRHLESEIAQRKSREEALSGSQRNLQNIVDNIPDLVWLKDRESRYIASNEAFGAACGRRPADLVGKTDLDIWPSELAENYRKDDRDVMASGIRKRLVEPFIDRNGQTQWVETIKTPVRDETGSITGTTGTARDITARKQVEEVLRDTTQRLQLATESAKHGVWDWDVVNNTMTWDDRMLELYGLTRETFPGGIEAWQNGLHPDDRDGTIEECQSALRGEKDWDTVFRVLHPDGTVAYIKANGIVIRDADGAPRRMLGVNLDITERHRAEERITGQLAELQRWQDVMLDREDRVQELKCEVNELCLRMGEAVRYASQEEV